MNDSTENRASRRSKARRATMAAVAGTAAAAMTVGLAGAPANAATTIDVTWEPFYTAGALAGLLNVVGDAIPGLTFGSDAASYNSGPPQNAFVSVATSVPLIGEVVINLTLLLQHLNDSSVDNLYNTLAGIPTPRCAGNYASNCRYALELATSEASLNLAEAYRTQIQSVTTGQTPAGFVPFEASPTSTAAKPTQTNQLLGFLQNPLRPNGGFYSRFPEWAEAFGINPEMPAAGKYKSSDEKIALNTSTLDVTWAYDPAADLPAVFNGLAFANSLWATLPLTLATGGETKVVISDGVGNPSDLTAVGLFAAQFLQLSLAAILGPPPDGKPFYVTLASNQLPILTPVRAPGLLINAALNALNSPYLLGNPFADAIEPALKILINTAYTDVLPPDKIDQCATGCGEGQTPKTWAELGYSAYDRSFLTGGVQTRFGSVQPLTPEERAAVPGDVWNALIGGIQAQFEKPFWGILVPANPQEAAPPAAVQAAAPVLPAAAVTPAAVEPAAPTPVANSIVAEPEPVDVAAVSPAVAEPGPQSAPEPAVAPQVEVPEPEPVVAALDEAAAEEAAAEEAVVAEPDLAELGAALDDEAPTETSTATSRSTRGGGVPSQRRGASSDTANAESSAAGDRDADS